MTEQCFAYCPSSYNSHFNVPDVTAYSLLADFGSIVSGGKWALETYLDACLEHSVRV